MNTIALRFGEHFSPECGTIAAHQEIINKQGYVWYGKLGAIINGKIRDELQKQENPKILLINSGKTDRYWAYFKEISLETSFFKSSINIKKKNSSTFLFYKRQSQCFLLNISR